MRFWPLPLIAVILVSILWLTLRPYGGNITALFHMDENMSHSNALTSDFVILDVPSYDGALYYHVARNIPRLLQPSEWHAITEKSPASYAYQRFLLPLTAWLLSGGNLHALPFVFLGVNFLALLMTAGVMLHAGIKPLYAIALALSPAAMVALHFSLAEPLVLLLCTIVLLRYEKHRYDWLSLCLLSLLVIAREINLLLVLVLIGHSVLQRRVNDVVRLCIPLGVFVAWHSVLFVVFGDFPFLTSAAARQLPGSAIVRLLIGTRGYDRYTLSAIALACAFVLPATGWILVDLWRRPRRALLPLGALAFLGIMLIMPDYIWGSMTSIGRVITPVYPFVLLFAASKDTLFARNLARAALILGMSIGLGLAMSIHPFHIAA